MLPLSHLPCSRTPRAISAYCFIVRIVEPIRFVARCRKRRLNHANFDFISFFLVLSVVVGLVCH